MYIVFAIRPIKYHLFYSVDTTRMLIFSRLCHWDNPLSFTQITQYIRVSVGKIPGAMDSTQILLPTGT